jgi:hypothetical protein
MESRALPSAGSWGRRSSSSRGQHDSHGHRPGPSRSSWWTLSTGIKSAKSSTVAALWLDSGYRTPGATSCAAASQWPTTRTSCGRSRSGTKSPRDLAPRGMHCGRESGANSTRCRSKTSSRCRRSRRGSWCTRRLVPCRVSFQPRWCGSGSGPSIGLRTGRLTARTSRGLHEIAIGLDNSISEPTYTTIALGLIERVMPVFEAAQQWPEARALPEARDAMEAYDKTPILREVERVVARARIATAADCPVCGETG